MGDDDLDSLYFGEIWALGRCRDFMAGRLVCSTLVLFGVVLCDYLAMWVFFSVRSSLLQ